MNPLGDVLLDGEVVHFPAAERTVLSLLLRNRGAVVAKAEMRPWLGGSGDTKLIDVYICKIRRRLDDASPGASKIIATIWGAGFRVIDDAARLRIVGVNPLERFSDDEIAAEMFRRKLAA